MRHLLRNPEEPPWWLRLVPRPLRYYLALRRLAKMIEHQDEIVRQIEEGARYYPRLIRALEGKEEPPDDAA